MLIPCVTVLLEYLDLFHTKCAKLPFLGAHFSNFPPIFPAFCSLLLPTYFSKKFAGKIGASLGYSHNKNTDDFRFEGKPSRARAKSTLSLSAKMNGTQRRTLTMKNAFYKCNQAIKTKFRRSKFLIPVASVSTGLATGGMEVTTPCYVHPGKPFHLLQTM